jgi:hypothetical protein
MTSIIKVDNLQNQCGANIISESANVITIGASGDTVTLAAGASQSGFGRSGSVNWDTTPKTSSPVTAVSGNGYFINTTSGAITVNLPATPAAGDIVAIADYANTSATNNITVGRNSSKIDGENKDGLINVNGQVYTLVYVDSTEGWKTVGQTYNQITLPAFVAATGGTVTCCGDYKIHTFTGPGTFTVTNAGNPAGSTTVDYLVVAGGGGAAGIGVANSSMAGGAAGGFRESKATGAPWTASPLASSTSLPVSVTGYPITVGGGGPGGPPGLGNLGTSGSDSVFSTITSTGGGRGGGYNGSIWVPGSNGGSGGGGGHNNTTGGSGNTPPVAPPQGNAGGTGSPGCGSAGGGGAGGVGASVVSPNTGGVGGDGAGTGINPSPTVGTPGPSPSLRYFAGGGAGVPYSPPGVPSISLAGGYGGGGPSTAYPPGGIGTAGTTNTGGGGGATRSDFSTNPGGAAGGSGIVVIRYKYQ